MTRYFFNVEDGLSRDATGVDLPDLTAAKCEAVKFAGQLLSDNAGSFWDTQQFAMNVTDAKGLTLFTLNFSGTDVPAIRSEAARP